VHAVHLYVNLYACPVYTFCWQGGFFRCERPHNLVQKNSDFSKFIVYPHQGRSQPEARGGEALPEKYFFPQPWRNQAISLKIAIKKEKYQKLNLKRQSTESSHSLQYA